MKLTPRVKRNVEIIKKEIYYYQFNNIKNPKDKNKNLLVNNTLINHYSNNSVEIKLNSNKKEENNEI